MGADSQFASLGSPSQGMRHPARLAEDPHLGFQDVVGKGSVTAAAHVFIGRREMLAGEAGKFGRESFHEALDREG